MEPIVMGYKDTAVAKGAVPFCPLLSSFVLLWRLVYGRSTSVYIPYVTALLIDQGILAGDMQKIYLYGLLMIGMALLSLLFGILVGRMPATFLHQW
ncbi:MAG: hypothetical protein MJZ73_07040 [Bacteroidaceae bacterium]|nr:hypothetical protein [Bacteroidaceae bacterium]